MSKAFISKSISEAAAVIAQGGVVVCPSEGVLGISCSLYDESAIERVIRIKERDSGKGLIIVDCSLENLFANIDFAKIDEHSKKLMDRMWPGPHTFVLPVKESFNSRALRPDHSAAIRITSFETLAALCRKSGTPLISTSANISGRRAHTLLKHLDIELFDRVDLILDLPCGGQSQPTSIYDTISHSLVREGPFWSDI